VRWILINTRSSADIITWECLKRLKHPRRKITPFMHPILGFRGQEVNPRGVICLLLRFRDKHKAQKLKVDFLVVDVHTAYNVIMGGQPNTRLSSSSSCIYCNFNMRQMMVVSKHFTEINRRLENATWSSYDPWWSVRMTEGSLGSNRRIKGHVSHLLLPLRPCPFAPPLR